MLSLPEGTTITDGFVNNTAPDIEALMLSDIGQPAAETMSLVPFKTFIDSNPEIGMKSAIRNYITDMEDLEQIVSAHVAEGLDEKDLPHHVRQYMANVCGMNNWEIKRYCDKRASVARHKAVAGKASDRSKLEELLRDAEAELLTTGDKLKAEILEKERELRSLEKNVATLLRRHTEVEGACNCLRDALPDHVETEISQRISSLKSTIGQPLGEARVERQHLELLKLDVGSPEHVDRVRISHRDLVQNAGNGRMARYQLKPEFSSFLQTLPAEIAKLDEFIAGQEEAFASGMLAINALRDYHLSE